VADDNYVQVNAWVEGVFSTCNVLVVNNATNHADHKFVNSLKELGPDNRKERMVSNTISATNTIEEGKQNLRMEMLEDGTEEVERTVKDKTVQVFSTFEKVGL
jgi:hypothetical protein